MLTYPFPVGTHHATAQRDNINIVTKTKMVCYERTSFTTLRDCFCKHRTALTATCHHLNGGQNCDMQEADESCDDVAPFKLFRITLLIKIALTKELRVD